MYVSFTAYYEDAILPTPLTSNAYVYQLFCAKVLFFENEAKIIFDTGVGAFIPEGFLAMVVPHQRFRFTDLSIADGCKLIEPGDDSLIELVFSHIEGIADSLPPEGEVVALMQLMPAVPFEARWSRAQPKKQTFNLN